MRLVRMHHRLVLLHAVHMHHTARALQAPLQVRRVRSMPPHRVVVLRIVHMALVALTLHIVPIAARVQALLLMAHIPLMVAVVVIAQPHQAWVQAHIVLVAL